jgi:hypothetical protein
MTDGEAIELAGRFAAFNLHVGHAGARRAFPHEGNHSIDGLFLALEDRLHAAIGQIAYPAGDAEAIRLLAGCVAEENALNAA